MAKNNTWKRFEKWLLVNKEGVAWGGATGIVLYGLRDRIPNFTSWVLTTFKLPDESLLLTFYLWMGVVIGSGLDQLINPKK